MANYNVDIGVKVRGEELKKFAEQLKQTEKQVDGVNRFLDTFRQQNIRVNESISNLNAQLAQAKSTFQSATIGTKQQVQAAKDLLQANQNLNKGLSEQQKLLDDLSGKTARKTGADNKKLQDALLKLERQSTREQEQQFLLRQQGQEQLKQKAREINQLRKEENKLLKDNVTKTKQSVANEIKKRFSIVASAKQRRRDLIISNRQVQTEIKINQILDARRRKQAAGGSGVGKRIGGTISSAAIGGAFPLLFGQTGAAAVGGGLGGLAGGAIGGQFGFALSIVGTAIGSAIDKNEKFNKSLAALNVQFSTTSGGTQVLAADVDKLAKRLSITKEEAIAALGAFKEFGSGSVAKSLVSIFGTDSGALDTLASTNRQAVLAQQIFDTRKQIGNQVAKQLLQQNLVNDQSTIELALAEAKAKALNDEAIAKAKVITFTDRLRASEDQILGIEGGPARFGEERARKIQEEFDKNRNKRLEDFKNSLAEVRELLGLVNEAQGQFGQSGVLAFSAINDKVKDLQDEMLKLQNPINQVLNLSQAMAQSFESSFAGIIKGTMSVQDAFRNMLNAMADHFIKTAARMAANQFQQGLLGMLSKSFAPEIPLQVNDIQNKIGTAADGGRIPGGKPTLVGERGPELFTPGVSGMVTPNHALGGSTNVVVNVDASGSNVEGDEQGGRELGRLISAAVQSEIVQQQRPGGLLA